MEEFDRIVVKLGLEHERTVLERLRAEFDVCEAHSEAETHASMCAKKSVVYQAQLSAGDLVGRPDFLIRHSSGGYQAADAKLKRDADDKEILIQLGVYQRLLGNGLPAKVFLGDGSVVELGEESLSVAERFISGMRELLPLDSPPPARHGATKCSACPYKQICLPEFRAKGELTLLPDIDSRNAPGLEAAGIGSIEQLAARDPETIPDLPYLKGIAKHRRAVLQARAYLEDRMFVLEPPNLPQGTWVHFDIETNPLARSGQEIVYLWGLLSPPYHRESFEGFWVDDEAGDRKGWLEFLTLAELLRGRYSDLIIAHYGNFEVTKIKMYAERYAMREHATVAWLLGEHSPLFDLCKRVEQSLILPLPGRGLKAVCKSPKLVNYQWHDEGSGSQWSVVQYVRFLETTDAGERQRLKDSILRYNFDDVMATRALEVWMRSLGGAESIDA